MRDKEKQQEKAAKALRTNTLKNQDFLLTKTISNIMEWENPDYPNLKETIPENTISIVSDLRIYLKKCLQNHINNSSIPLPFPNDWNHNNQNIQKRLRMYLLGANKVEQTIYGWSLVNKNKAMNKIREINNK